MPIRSLFFTVFILALAAHPAGAAPLPADPSGSGQVALRLEKGSVARHQLVAIGRDLILDGEAQADVAAIEGSVAISGSVTGDVVVLGGDARLAPTARIAGDVFVLGGTISASPGAQIEGRSVSYRNASVAWMTLLEGPSLGLESRSTVVVGAKLALLAAWSALLMLLFAACGRQLISTADEIKGEPFRGFFTGLVGVLALVLTALFFSAFAGALIGVPLLVLVVLAALALKLWGMVAVFYALGDFLLTRVFRRRMRPASAATLGLLLLGLVKFVPYLGVWAWTIASLIGVGATLATKFGSRAPWFQGA
ncbi:MAG TPA: polymer-forming cytoskeletal protein [Thermoanaerobaculia bacterium]|nr:polymer-forming cytoskeletal protein [Thermoanaerobaculia bacterium]